MNKSQQQQQQTKLKKIFELSDDIWDGITAVSLIVITLFGTGYWLSSVSV